MMCIRSSFRAILLLVAMIVTSAAAYGQIHALKKFGLQQADSVSSLPPGNSVSHLNVDSSSLWIGTSQGLASSEDGGRTWTSYRNDPAFVQQGIFAIGTLSDTVWAAMGYDQATSDGSVQTGSGYAYTIDHGASWHRLPQTLDRRGDSLMAYGINDSLWVLPVVVPEQNVTFDISVTPGAVWIASWASGLRKSTDRGAHWQRILLPSDVMDAIHPTDTLFTFAQKDSLHLHRIYQRFDPRANNNLLGFSVLAEDNDTIWCGTAGGVNKSTDGGLSWRRFNHQNQASPILGNWVIAIRQQRLSNGIKRIWITDWKANDPDEDYGVSYTDDRGTTWHNLLNGIKAYDFAFKDSNVYIATDNGIYRTADDGASFVKFGFFTDNSRHQVIATSQVLTAGVLGDTVYIGTPDGMASTIDNATHIFGATWRILRTYQPVAAGSTTYAFPNPFSPSLEVVRIHYRTPLSAGAATQKVQVELFDFGMNRIRTLLNSAVRQSDNDYDEIWDGLDDSGRMVASGVYFYRVTLESGDPFFGKILVIK